MTKLYYWPIHGRAEPIRMLLSHAGVSFEDIEVTPEIFARLTQDDCLEFEQLPMLELPTGERLCQTKAILRMLGTVYGYYKIEERPDLAWQIDSIVDSVADALA